MSDYQAVQMSLNELIYIYIGTVHEDTNLSGVRCVYKCRICRISILKKLQCLLFGL